MSYNFDVQRSISPFIAADINGGNEITMEKSVEALFDGKVLRPMVTRGLRKNVRYRLRFEPAVSGKPMTSQKVNNPLLSLSSIAIDAGVADYAAEHDHYLYQTPKRGHGKRA
jgi:hypothetical protein